jgi:hypothetical protein
MAIFEVCQGAKAVPLDLKEPLRMGKGPRRTANRRGLKMRQHLSNNKGFLAAVFKKGQTWFSRSGKRNDPSMSAPITAKRLNLRFADSSGTRRAKGLSYAEQISWMWRESHDPL